MEWKKPRKDSMTTTRIRRMGIPMGVQQMKNTKWNHVIGRFMRENANTFSIWAWANTNIHIHV